MAVPLVQKAQARYSALRACSFDRGFHSPDNRVGLDALLDLNACGSEEGAFRSTFSPYSLVDHPVTKYPLRLD